jgi:protein arginine kinase
MLRWFDNVGQSYADNYISSRIRLARNLKDHAFPWKLDTFKSAELVGKLIYGLSDISDALGEPMETYSLDQLSEPERMAMRERRLFNMQTASKKEACAVMVSRAEDISLILNGDDHIRMQFLGAGMCLDELWPRASRLDEYVGSKFEYACSEKYGYLTTFPTNVGTGMKANAVVHLPMLSKQNNFPQLIEGMSRLGVSVRGVYGKKDDNFGDLYDISNTKTLGLDEQDIIAGVKRVAGQLNAKEIQVRDASLKSSRNIRLDEAYKSYGVLRYARKLSVRETMIYLSHLRAAISDELVHLEKNCNIYALMLEVQPFNLMSKADKPLSDEELDMFRADYIRRELPRIKED